MAQYKDYKAPLISQKLDERIGSLLSHSDTPREVRKVAVALNVAKKVWPESKLKKQVCLNLMLTEMFRRVFSAVLRFRATAHTTITSVWILLTGVTSGPVGSFLPC